MTRRASKSKPLKDTVASEGGRDAVLSDCRRIAGPLRGQTRDRERRL